MNSKPSDSASSAPPAEHVDARHRQWSSRPTGAAAPSSTHGAAVTCRMSSPDPTATPDWSDPVIIERILAGREPGRAPTRAEQVAVARALHNRADGSISQLARLLHMSQQNARALWQETT